MIGGVNGELSQRRERLEVSRMAKKIWIGTLVAGMLIVLAFTAGACSGQTPNMDVPPDSEIVNRSIKVYESPT